MVSKVYINEKQVEVLDRIAVINRLTNSKIIQPDSFYNNFIKHYKVPRDIFNDIYFELNLKKYTRTYFIYENIIELCSYSIDSTIWLVKFLDLMNTNFRRGGYTYSHFDLMFDKFINYPIEFSDNFNRVPCLLSLYRDIILEYNTMSCNLIIPISLINDILQLQNCGLTELDIRKDLNTHGVISQVNDKYYEWINKSFLLWLNKTSCTRLFQLEHLKLFKSLHHQNDIYCNHLDQYRYRPEFIFPS